jgi:asparagine synthase (glutamine-hydrolysing)
VSGFVGLANAGGAPVDAPMLMRLTEAMAYCGPDGRDTWAGESIGLGHALLSFAPEAGGLDAQRQPATLDGQVWIAADARIDGRAELARELRAAGRDVSPDTTDAALILHAHAAWGDRCPEHLIGDFAFAVWDADRRELFCARDHFGLVPCYYAEPDRGLVVGNVLRVLLAHPGVSDTLNDQAIGDFLALDCNHDLTTTTFADVRSLAPAHTLTWRDGEMRVRRYWELDARPPELRLDDPREYVERFAAALDSAVDDRLRSGRVGVSLSGGMDSGSLAAAARDVLRRRGGPFDLRAYTIVFGELMPEEEEGRYAEQTAARLGMPQTTILADEQLARAPGESTWTFPEPARITGQLPDYEVLARIAGFARAALTGHGGDPLFITRSPVRGALRAGRLPRLGIRTALRRRWRYGHLDEMPDWIEGDFAARNNLSTRRREMLGQARGARGVSALASPLWPALFSRGHPGALGLLVRPVFPFFDLRVVRCVAETPIVPWRQNKRLLRQAMQGRLPPAVIDRPKTVLYAPNPRHPEPWFRLALRPEVRRQREGLLEASGLNRYVDVTRARELVQSPASPGMFQFERCLALAHWLQKRKDGDGRPA